jgi:hypothetical protein
MWCALDDVNKNGKELPAITFSNLSQEFSGNPNAILSYNTYLTAGLFTGPEPDANPIASFNVSFSGDLGDSVIIPSEASYSGGSVEPLQRIELSDLQIFTGVTLDTGSVANRRAFVDANGLPVPPAATAVVVEPGAPPSLIVGGSIELLGKKPEIVLRGSGNWIGGRNTGTLGMDNNGVSIPSGQFIPTGNIIRYVPDPQLSGHSVLPTIRKVQLSKRPVREGVFRR